MQKRHDFRWGQRQAEHWIQSTLTTEGNCQLLTELLISERRLLGTVEMYHDIDDDNDT